MSFIELGVVFLIGFVIGELYLAFRIRKVLENMVDDSMEEAASATVEVYKLKTEVTPDSILLYDEANAFICQGKTIEELAKLALEYSGIKYAAVMHNGSMFTFFDGTVKETL
jgi:hypothetical protein